MSASSAPTANGSNTQAVVLAQLHLSCFVTAANRATPVFDVQPERRCVRVAARESRDAGAVTGASSATAGNGSPTSPSGASAVVAGRNSPGAEWEFHTVFSSTPATHSADFFREVSLPALLHVCDAGLNTNIIATGIHPTQKFRLLYGKSTGADGVKAPLTAASEGGAELLDSHGQVGALLGEFFHCHAAARVENASWLRAPARGGDWHVGISSWIIVNNTAVDLLKALTPTRSSPGAATGADAFTFVSVEAATLSTALAILQTAKTNRIVMKQSAEHSHFFVRLAFFRSGQLSTLHVADLADLKEFRDALAVQEKQELYDVLQEIRQLTKPRAPPLSPRGPNGSSPSELKPRMVLASFLQPLLTSNAKTFLYANVIDSRACIRENVALLNAVANLRGFACVCKRLVGVELSQLGFQPFTQSEDPEPESLDSAAAKAMAAVAIGESLLSRLAGVTGTRAPEPAPQFAALPVDDAVATAASPAVTADASTWLEAFRQRKQDILANGPRASTTERQLVSPVACGPSSSSAAARGGAVVGTTSSDLYARLMESIQPSSASPSARSCVGRSSALPLPIEDPGHDDDDADEGLGLSPLPPPPRPRPLPAPSSARCNQSWHDVLEQANLPTQVLPQPNVDGLDADAARRVQASDAALLRRNYDALLTVVQEQQRLREAAETRAADAVRDQEELRAQHELQIENLKLEAANLRRKLRAMERQSPAAAVFQHYEQDMESLHREVQQLRALNVQLELRVAGGAETLTASGASDAAVFGGGHGSLAELKKRYQAMAEERQALAEQLLEYRKRERQFLAQSKLVNESTRKVDRLSRELSAKEESLLVTRLGKQRLDAEVQQAQQEAEQLQQENDRLLMEKAATTEELLATKMYLASVESEQKKAEILDRFVRKHGDRMSRLRLQGNASAIAPMLDSDAWRRDAQARETEEKLFQSVKRSQPQLVPLVNKVLRKLEMQELSLREYAEREVDFINLLVELVSDQPAVTLREMIESEMRKLSLVA
ncbi:hypothetical protein P43SY_005451 [Pythium insidiosum]|uniref:Uncharacterized protein n=1 Tax=Pythium insidiosum TaxID=114742 RepID=A0AAD5LJY5_PYTIN|nr:hypothetical protein P43SY_005451 [Pythium insidiosum]